MSVVTICDQLGLVLLREIPRVKPCLQAGTAKGRSERIRRVEDCHSRTDGRGFYKSAVFVAQPNHCDWSTKSRTADSVLGSAVSGRIPGTPKSFAFNPPPPKPPFKMSLKI